ncbi:MAG: hypothetical protein GX222_02135 [Ruminococcaceae bacterium]|nr:hypothetical protein [Oscillospiraceae bacterium]
MFKEDIAPELLLKIQQDFQRSIEENTRIKELFKLLKSQKATYAEANEYAILIGENLAATFKKHITSDVLPDGRMYYNIADRILKNTLENNHKLIADYSAEVQAALNKQAGIGIKALKPELNIDRIEGIVNRVASEENFDNVSWILDEPVVNYSQSVVDAAIKINAAFHFKSGLSPRIIRTSTGKCCDWCNKLVGVYDYQSVRDTGNDVFRRHRFCKCTVEYDPRDSKKVNVHTHKESGSKEDKEARIKLYEKQRKQLEKEEEKRRKLRIEKAKFFEEEQKQAIKERRERLIHGE